MIFRTFLFSILSVLLAAPASIAQPKPVDRHEIDVVWAARWRHDLDFARIEMAKTHIRIDHTTPLAELNSTIDDLERRLPTLAHHEAVVELARIVAMIGDGHTRLTLPLDPASGFVGGHRRTEEATLPGAPFHHYPVRFFLYDDGLAIERIDAARAGLLGARVTRIGSMSTEEALAAVDPVIHRDNEIQVRERAVTFLVVPEILDALDIIDDLGAITLEIETPSGHHREVRLDPVPTGQQVEWAERDAASSPLFRRHLDRNYRYEYLEEQKAVYFRYVAVQNEDEGESLPDFARRMFAAIDSRDVESLIVDIRGNGGGNNWLNAPLERGIIRAESLWRPGGLVVLADRYTFSAAMNFANFLAGDTPAIFVGEGTGGRPNHYGDADLLQLPNTGLTVRLSTRYHQDAGAGDDREQIDPHVPTRLSAADILAGRDPALDEILSWNRPGDLVGTWKGPATMRRYATEVTVELSRSDQDWTGTFTAPGWFETTAIVNAERAGDEIRFDVPLETTTIRVRARAAGDRLLGMFDYQGQWYAFVGERR